jgi:hypothetical protein
MESVLPTFRIILRLWGNRSSFHNAAVRIYWLFSVPIPVRRKVFIMAAVIVITCVLVVLVAVFFVFLTKLIIDLVKKNKKGLALNIVMLASSFFFFVALGIVDIVLFGLFVYQNRDEIVNTGLEVTSDIVSQGFVMTYEGIVKTWDKELMKRLDNIDVSVDKVDVQKEKNDARYTIKVLFNNHNKKTESTSMSELIGGNYLMVCDKNDRVYELSAKDQEGYYLPSGKSAASLTVSVAKDVRLSYLRFAEKKIFLPAE